MLERILFLFSFILPFSRGVKPANALNSVDFPDPFSPFMIVTKPVSITELKSENIVLEPLLMVKFSKLIIDNSNKFYFYLYLYNSFRKIL